jgi:hypothetical protein
MTKERYQEIKNRIEWLEDVLWSIQLIDHWTREDRNDYERFADELKKLKEQVVNEIFKEE